MKYKIIFLILVINITIVFSQDNPIVIPTVTSDSGNQEDISSTKTILTVELNPYLIKNVFSYGKNLYHDKIKPKIEEYKPLIQEKYETFKTRIPTRSVYNDEDSTTKSMTNSIKSLTDDSLPSFITKSIIYYIQENIKYAIYGLLLQYLIYAIIGFIGFVIGSILLYISVSKLYRTIKYYLN